MTGNSAILLCVLLSVLPAQSQAGGSLVPQLGHAIAKTEREIIDTVRARAKALASGDCREWSRYVDANFRAIEGSETNDRKAIIRGCEASRRIQDYRQERIVSDFHFIWIGRIPMVDYRYQTVEHFGEITLSETVRQVCTLEKRQNSWIALLAVNVPLAHDPPAEKIDPKTLDELTGVYSLAGAPHFEDSVLRNGDKLFVQGTGDSTTTELVPLGKDTFFIHGSFGDQLRFIRDAQGKVVGEEVHSPYGQGYRATKSNEPPVGNEFDHSTSDKEKIQ